MKLLLPLANIPIILDSHDWKSKLPTLQQFHQDLHDVVAVAGYVAIRMALSPTIFYFEFPGLGDRWEAKQVSHLDPSGDPRGGEENSIGEYLVSMVLWPAVTRYKPRSVPRGAAGVESGEVVSSICKARCIYRRQRVKPTGQGAPVVTDRYRGSGAYDAAQGSGEQENQHHDSPPASVADQKLCCAIETAGGRPARKEINQDGPSSAAITAG